jgi:hypothetical protein
MANWIRKLEYYVCGALQMSALQQLRVLLNQTIMNVDEYCMPIATALRLASFDVFTISITVLILSVSSMIQSNVSEV